VVAVTLYRVDIFPAFLHDNVLIPLTLCWKHYNSSSLRYSFIYYAA